MVKGGTALYRSVLWRLHEQAKCWLGLEPQQLGGHEVLGTSLLVYGWLNTAVSK